MSDEHVDPSGSTEQFKAFVQHTEAPSGRGFPVGVLVAALAAVVAVAVVIYLVH